MGEYMKRKKQFIFKRRASSRDISILCKQFSVLLAAGINLSEVLNILSVQGKNKMLRQYLFIVYQDVQKGEELGEAMNRLGYVFPNFMLQMIKIGEQSGKLEYIFKSLSEYYYNENNIKRKLRDALRYPVIVFIITIIIFLFLMTKVVPMFGDTLVSLGGKLPLITIILLTFSSMLTKNIVIILIGFIANFLLLYLFLKTNIGKLLICKLKLSTPLLKNLYKRILTVKFSKYLNILLSSGFNVISSLQILSGIMGSMVVERKIKASIDFIKVGETLTYSINKIGIFDPLLISMVSVGEESGKLEEMLCKVAEIYEEDVYEIIEKGTKLIEPTMIITLAAFIGTIILSVIIPMFSIMDNMGG